MKQTLLCCCSKIFEKLIFDEISNFFWTRIHPSQYGFWKKRSATLQLIFFLDKLYQHNDLESTKELSVLYLNFTKTFDTVPHDKSLLKLEEQGLGGSVIGISTHTYLIDNMFKSIRKGPAKKLSPAVYHKGLSLDHYYSSSSSMIYLKR